MLGHLPHGNPVQRHSAGEHYPYVIAVVDSPAGRRFEVVGPRLGSGYRFATAEAAEDCARWCARNLVA